jgi:hypothetical protein
MVDMRATLTVLSVLLLSVGSAHANLVVNGGFEGSGNCSYSGWTLSGQTNAGVDYGLSRAWQGGNVFDGRCSAWFGPADGTTTLSQYVPTVVGQEYLVSAWVWNTNEGQAPDNLIQAWFEGTRLLNGVNVRDAGWTYVSTIVTAGLPASYLGLTFQNVPGYFELDDVSVDPVPEPGALILCGSGLGLLILLRRASRRASAR